MATTSLATVDRKILAEMLSIPTAPFAEHLVIERIHRFIERRKPASIKVDSAGNLLIRVRQGKRTVKRPVCLTAHLDHPGFVADRMTGRRRVRAFWRGGVPPEYFSGSRVRFFVDGGWVKGTIKSIKTVTRAGVRRVEAASIEVPADVPPHTIGMWDFPDPFVKNHRIYARGCDDMAGAAAMLCCIDTLVRKRYSCDAYFLFTRAEEVGFIGAIAACRLGTIPKKCVVVAMETSSELASAQMGDGPILRVGDRTSAFTPAATAHCHRVARALQRDNKSFKFQRKLMDGGTCESSAYCTLGYEATGMCLALGNYHNVDRKKGKLGPEYIDLRDFDHVVKWFIELARAPVSYTGTDEALDKQLRELEKTYKPLLRSSFKSRR